MKILFYGDSNTWGYDAKDASRQKNRFTQFIKQEFSQHEIIEEGLCGRTLCLDDPYDEDRNGTKMISMVLKTHAPIDVVFIMLGTNDAKRQFSTNSISLESSLLITSAFLPISKLLNCCLPPQQSTPPP